jgi:hypothetical protein
MSCEAYIVGTRCADLGNDRLISIVSLMIANAINANTRWFWHGPDA